MSLFLTFQIERKVSITHIEMMPGSLSYIESPVFIKECC